MNEWMSKPAVEPDPVAAPAPPRIVERPLKMSMLKKIVIAVIVAGVLFVGFLGWWVLSGNTRSLSVGVVLPERVQTGVPVDLEVTMENSSGSDLSDAQVSVSLPDGFMFVGTPGRRSVENRRIGMLEANKLTKETFMVMATGIENSVVQVQVSVSYVPGALSSRFEQQVEKEVIVGESGIELTVAPPTKAFGGEEFTTEISYRNVSLVNFEDVQLKMTYPEGFTFKSSTVAAADAGNSTWKIGAMPAGAEQKFLLKGHIVGQDNENFEIKGELIAAIGEGSYTISEQTATVAMEPSPLSVRIEVLPEQNASFGVSDFVRYRLNYSNNTTSGLRDVIVRARLIGEMFDLKTLKTDGVLRASDNTIVWNASRVPAFASLAPGATGVVDFSLQTKAAYPITRLSSKNYTLTVHAEIESPTVPRNVAADKTLGIAELTNKVRGSLEIDTLGYYRDIEAGIANAGVFPPRVGQPTQFTIHWVLRNTSTDVEAVRARAFLGPNVRYTNVSKVTDGASSTLEYNSRTQEMVWTVPKISATRGVLSDPIEAIFQVELTPAIDQVKTNPEIIQRTNLEYKDLFTGEQLAGTHQAITTRLPDDATVTNSGQGIVE